MERRLIVVLGYSEPGSTELHSICRERLARAATISTADDVVVLSGWARHTGTRSEAELMAAAWNGRSKELVIDPDARTTVSNAANTLDDVRRTRPVQVVVVTSPWHARRAVAAFRWLLRGTGTIVISEGAPGGGTFGHRLRELACLVVLPIQLALVPRSLRTEPHDHPTGH